VKTYRVNEIFYSRQGEGVRVGTLNLFLRFTGCNLTCMQETHGFDCDTEFASGRDLTLDQIIAALAECLDDANASNRDDPSACRDDASTYRNKTSTSGRVRCADHLANREGSAQTVRAADRFAPSPSQREGWGEGSNAARDPVRNADPTKAESAPRRVRTADHLPLPTSKSEADQGGSLNGLPVGFNSARDSAHNPDPTNWIILTGGEPALQVDDDLIGALHAAGYKLAIETNGSIALPDGIDWITVSPKVAEHAIRQRVADEVKYVRGYGQAIPKTVVNAKHKLISPAFDGNTLPEKTLAWCEQLVRDNPEWQLSMQMHKVWGVR